MISAREARDSFDQDLEFKDALEWIYKSIRETAKYGHKSHTFYGYKDLKESSKKKLKAALENQGYQLSNPALTGALIISWEPKDV